MNMSFFRMLRIAVARIKLMAVVTSWLSPTSWAVKVGQVLAIIVVCAYAGATAAQSKPVNFEMCAYDTGAEDEDRVNIWFENILKFDNVFFFFFFFLNLQMLGVAYSYLT